MDFETLRLECLKMAQAEGLKGSEAIARAQEFFDFLRVGADSATETRRIVAGMQNKHVRVIGVGDDSNFRDYIADKDK